MPTRNVTLTEELDSFVTMTIESGSYEDVSEVIRAALGSLQRDQQDRDTKLTHLRAAIDEGDASGQAEDGVFDRIRQSLRIQNIP